VIGRWLEVLAAGSAAVFVCGGAIAQETGRGLDLTLPAAEGRSKTAEAAIDLKTMPKPIFSAGLASVDVRSAPIGNELEGRLLGAFSQFPVAFGASFTEGTHLRKASAGFSYEPVPGTALTVLGQVIDQSSQSALGILSSERLITNGVSSKLQQRLDGFADGRFAVFGLFDYWNSPGGKTLIDTNTFTATFEGARGYRAAPGLRFDVNDTLSVSLAAGVEKAWLGGVDGQFYRGDIRQSFGRFGLELSGWQSANYGKGAQLTLSYTFDNALTAAVYGGATSATGQSYFAGLRLSMPLGGPMAFEGPANLVAARQHAVKITRKPIVVYLYETMYGTACTGPEPTPSCTFDRSTGARITVTADPDYDRYGFGSDDLGFVTFDGAGNAAVYDDLGHFQYFTDVSHFTGYIGGTTIGVGTTGVYWENVAHGTYWLGRNGVLYSANLANANFGQAIN
jgi:hypothetical protein